MPLKPGRFGKWAIFVGAMALLSACAGLGRETPAGAFAVAETLACTQAQLTVADPGCLVFSDPRATDSADRAMVLAEALEMAGYDPIKVWTFPTKPGSRTLGFTEVLNRGPCFKRRDCGEPWPYYVAVALSTPDGLQVIDPSLLRGPGGRTEWLSRLVLGGKSLVDVTWETSRADAYRPEFGADGQWTGWTTGDVETARAGLKAAYCALPNRRADFRGHERLRGYDRPGAVHGSCSGS